ncbi:PEP-CTERM/exosortase system-associated acyltransferase [Desulfuromonas acetoxidans]|uniref:PEP-CTERM/exosortase system-associated acyltransferase n=1 Tax=Desulfuromonas acetoxidans TaxID=891 RepID=UPI00292E17B6|nr:PEP-CTERM/exosortase system-associated acyltransferase [Desulfuromonas acetoxidans]
MTCVFFQSVPNVVAENFRFKYVDVDHFLMEEIYRLRYQVYCVERGFECLEDHPGGLEMDIYDRYSNHFCVVSTKSEKIIGTVRLILDSSIGLPIERHCVLDEKKKYAGAPTKIGEISRLAVSKHFRRTEISRVLGELQNIDLKGFDQVERIKHSLEEYLIVGLYQCLYHHSLKLGLTHWYAVMTEGVYALLRQWGVVWTQVGEETDYHGRRIPYLAEIEKNEQSVSLSNPQLLELPNGWEA